ncbi:MAG: hypothetical protein ACYC49_03895 [Ignavibacteriaceae bacterium]
MSANNNFQKFEEELDKAKKYNKLKPCYDELNKKYIELKNAFDLLENNFNKLKKNYSENIYDQLNQFEGFKLLNQFISGSYFINNRKHLQPELFMDHILYQFMIHNIFSLIKIVNYEVGSITNLEKSYIRSLEIMNNLNNNEGSLAWYINQRLPLTYIKANSVDIHLAEGIKVKKLKGSFSYLFENELIDARRMHLFYDLYFGKYKYAGEHSDSLIFTLLLEFLNGIDNKVILINYNSVKNNMFNFIKEKDEKEGNNFFKLLTKSKDILNTPIFLLDFAIYFSKNTTGYLYGDADLLCADFTAENPTSFTKVDEASKTGASYEYEQDKVYDLKNSVLFLLFKNYFLGLWNKDSYIEYLKNFSNKDENIIDFGIELLVSKLDKDIRVISFKQFWEKNRDVYKVNPNFKKKLNDEYIDYYREFCIQFDMDNYKKKFKIADVNNENIYNNLLKKIETYDPKIPLEEHFSEFILRSIHHNPNYLE